MLFQKIEGTAVVLKSKGIFKQVDLYQRGNELFAKWGSGFIGLRPRNGTTLPNVSWEHIDGVDYSQGATGPLTIRGLRLAAE